MLNPASTLLLAAVVLGLGAAPAFACEAASTTPAAASQQTTQAAQVRTPARDDLAAVKPGDPDCIRDTGSRIRGNAEHCLPVAGRSYSREELQRTGQVDTGRALQMLDPRITLGH